jgi:hypothetical protein
MSNILRFFRHDQDSKNGVVPRFTDRLVIDRSLRGRLGPGGKFLSFLFPSKELFYFHFKGTLNPEEDCKEAENYLRNQGRLSAPSTLTYNPSKQQQSVSDQTRRDELARHFMYTSVQQAAFDEVPWGLFQ